MLEPNDTSKSVRIEAFAGGSVEHSVCLRDTRLLSLVIQAGDIDEALDPSTASLQPDTLTAVGISNALGHAGVLRLEGLSTQLRAFAEQTYSGTETHAEIVCNTSSAWRTHMQTRLVVQKTG